MKRLLSGLLLMTGTGLLLFGSYLIYLRNSPSTINFNRPPTTVNPLSYSAPTRLLIPHLEINLPIVPAVIHDNRWQTTVKGVSYLQSSPLPGEKGNSILYGHNWRGLLGNLSQIKPGQEIVIVSDRGDKIIFVVEYTAVVNPDQTYIIDNTFDTRITLYTCTGFLDSKRFVVVAIPSA